MKKIVCLLITLTLIIGSISAVSASTWSSYFGLNKGWYEGTKGVLTSNTSKGWTAKISDIGWGGCWGGQVYQRATITKGRRYTIKFSIKSSKLDKWVYLKIGDAKGKKMNLGKWIDCKKGKTVTVNESFTAKYNGQSIYFGIGGDFGDRAGVKTDTDAKVRYKYAPNKKLDSRLGPDAAAKHPTVITVSGFYFSGQKKGITSTKMKSGFLVLEKGQKSSVKLVGAKGKVKWTASNRSIIRLTKKGKNKVVVKARNTGLTTIIAKNKKKKYKCYVMIF